MNWPDFEYKLLLILLIVVIITSTAIFVLLPSKPAAIDEVVGTMNEYVDSTINAAKCPSCVFEERQNKEGEEK